MSKSEELIAREALDDAIASSDEARQRQARAGDYYLRATNDDPDIGVIRAEWFAACSGSQRAADAEKRAQEALDKILEAHAARDPEHVTYSEVQIRAAFESLGGMDALAGYHTLMTALGKHSRTKR